MKTITQRTCVAVVLTLMSAYSTANEEDGYLSKGNILVRDVTIIDGLGNPQKAHQDILIEDGKIADISDTGEITASSSARVIDGEGLTAIPGLIDMHYHLKPGWTGGVVMQDEYPIKFEHKELQQSLAALLYSGVTTAFDMGARHSWIVAQRDEINSGEYIGPRYHVAGVPISQTPTGWDGAVRAETVGEPPLDALATKVTSQDPDDLNKLLDMYSDNGISIIKLYAGMSALSSSFLLKEADKRGIRAVADLWQLNMSGDYMRASGLHGWAHASPYPMDKASLEWMAANDKFVVATANVGEKMSGLRVKEDGDKQSFFENPLIMDIWGRQVVEDFYASYPEVRENMYEGPHSFYQVFNFGDLSTFRDVFLTNIKNAHDAGVLVACGTDSPAYPSLWSGETMHREMELMVMAGISPIDTIQLCTYNGARILQDEDEYGSLQEGLVADIVLVEGKPWEDISDTRNIRHVLVRGGLLDREKLLTSWH